MPLASAGCEFEHIPETIRSAHRANAINIACRVNQQPACRAAQSIQAAGESVDHCQAPDAVAGGLELIDHAKSVRASGRSHSVELAVLVKGHWASGTRPVVAASKLVDHTLGPDSAGIIQLVNDAAAALTRASAARHRRAVEIAMSVERHAFVGFSAIRPTG